MRPEEFQTRELPSPQSQGCCHLDVPRFTALGALWTPSLRVFMEAPLHRPGQVGGYCGRFHLQLLSLPAGPGWDGRFQPSHHRAVPPATSLVLRRKSGSNRNPGVKWLITNNRTATSPSGSETISGTEDKRPNIMTKKKMLPLLLFQEIPRVLGAGS